MENEFDLIDWIRDEVGGHDFRAEIVRAIGDDCAVLSLSGGMTTVTTDVLVEEVDFRLEWTSPSLLGRKALAVSLSDLAAMGSRPVCCLLTLSLPRHTPSAFPREFVAGFLDRAELHHCPLVGGDLSSSSQIQVSVTAIGSVAKGTPIYRDGAKPGDRVVAIGGLGLSRLGLEILQTSPPYGLNRVRTRAQLDRLAGETLTRACLQAHLDPEPLLEVGLWLQQSGLVNSMIDVSDGLSSDLWRIARESSVKAVIDADRLALLQTAWGETMAFETVLNGGEDYALLLTASKEHVAGLRDAYPTGFPPLQEIGSIEEGDPALFLKESTGLRKLEAAGFDHFR